MQSLRHPYSTVAHLCAWSCATTWLLLGAAGCAAPATPAPDVAAAQTDCKQSYRVGSNIASKTCVGPQTEEERQQVISELQHQVRMLSEPSKGGGQ